MTQTYHNLVTELQRVKVINDTGEELDLFAAADGIFKDYEKDILAATTESEGKIYSDVYNGSGNQIIDLVQEGGGMWGIALIGYTYILEKAGLRFNSVAGTSAGAINTMCLAAIPDDVYKDGTKSKLLTHIIANHDFSDFVDRKPGIIKWLLTSYIKTSSNIGIKLICFLCWILFSTVLYFIIGGLFFPKDNDSSLMGLKIALYVLGSLLAFLPPLVVYWGFKKSLGMKFGLNPGNKARDYIRKVLGCMKIHTTKDLYDKLQSEVFTASTRTGNGDESIKGSKVTKRIVLIASNLTHNRIVKFPERALDYFHNMEIVDPSLFVRASMSIPFFFECVSVDNSLSDRDSGGPGNIKMSARFVDGGMLSNFPIREFHNSSKAVPRFPTLGVRLGINEKEDYHSTIKLSKYLGSFLSTFRGFYDNDFIEGNEETKAIVKTIETGDISWLNFSMSKQDKITLFQNGAKAACEHLKDFDWKAYKLLRNNLYLKNIAK